MVIDKRCCQTMLLGIKVRRKLNFEFAAHCVDEIPEVIFERR